MTTKFDVDADMIRRLAGLIDETGLTEIEYDDGTRKIRVARGPAPVAAQVPPTPPQQTVESRNQLHAQAAPQAADAGHPGAVTAPMVGTAYLQPDPQAPQFVNIGDRVEKGDTLLIIEAMKVMNQIPAPRSGTVRQILVANGHPVEYGEVLMIID